MLVSGVDTIALMYLYKKSMSLVRQKPRSTCELFDKDIMCQAAVSFQTSVSPELGGKVANQSLAAERSIYEY